LRSKAFNRKVREDCAKAAKIDFGYQVKGCDDDLVSLRCLARRKD
jgi:hypothetical protein